MSSRRREAKPKARPAKPASAPSRRAAPDPAIHDVVVAPDALVEPRTALVHAVAKEIGCDPAEIRDVEVLRQGIDARHGRVRMQLRVAVYFAGQAQQRVWEPGELAQMHGAPEVIIVGFGPTGMFCAYRLAQLGIRAIVCERGKDVRARRVDLAALNRNGELNPESNYCFGEGGAGTYSDGKLYTRSTKRGPVEEVLQILAAHGAPAEILVDSRPHVGTNRLPKVIASMRDYLIAHGVEVRFGARVDAVITHPGTHRACGVRLQDGQVLEAPHVVVATGHSAPEVLDFLEAAGAQLRSKPFAAGVRIEHPQTLVDRLQYGSCAGHPVLGAASYHLVSQVLERSVHSFCMCPGGVIVPSSTAVGQQVVNGMSPYQRRGKYANSGFVVQILPEHLAAVGLDPLAPKSGLVYQAELERRAFVEGGGKYVAPAQRLCDLVADRESKEVSPTSYHLGLAPTHLRAVLRELYDPIAAALGEIAKKMPGFLGPEANAVGVESRTSSPVQLVRDPHSLVCAGLPGVYACGEGAGYAGGIVSAALDGMRVAMAIGEATSRTSVLGKPAARAVRADA